MAPRAPPTATTSTIDAENSTALSPNTIRTSVATRRSATNAPSNRNITFWPNTATATTRSGQVSGASYAEAITPDRAMSTPQAIPDAISLSRIASANSQAIARRSARWSATNRAVDDEIPRSAGSAISVPIPIAKANVPYCVGPSTRTRTRVRTAVKAAVAICAANE